MNDRLDQLITLVGQLNKKIERQDQRIQEIEKRLHIETKSEVRPIQQATTLHTPKPAIAAQPKPTDWRSLEMQLGKYWLQLAGVAIFLVGMAFLLKYSIEQGWISPLVRILAGLCAATVLVALPELLRKKLDRWSVEWTYGCTAGGLVLYYISFYAAYAFYGLLTLHQVFYAIAATTLLAVGLAIWHNAYIIGVFSLLGAYATPVLLNVGQLNSQFLAGYLLVLGLGFLILSYKKEWFSLGVASFLCMLLYVEHIIYRALSLHEFVLFVVAAWAIFTLIPIAYVCVRKIFHAWFELAVVALSGIYSFIAIAAKLITAVPNDFESAPHFVSNLFANATHSQIYEYTALVFGIVYLALTLLVGWLARKHVGLLATVGMFTMSFFAIAIFAHYSGYALSNALHVYALLLFIIGLAMQLLLVRAFAYVFWFVSIGNLLRQLLVDLFYGNSVEHIVLNKVNGTCALVFVIFAAAAYCTHRFKNYLSQEEAYTPNILMFCALMTVVYWMQTGVWHYPYYIMGLIAYAGILMSVGLYYNAAVCMFSSYISGGLAAICFALHHDNLLRWQHFININVIFAIFVTVFFGTLILLRRTAQRSELRTLENILKAKAAGIFFVLAWGRALIMFRYNKVEQIIRDNRPTIEYLARTMQTDVMLTLYYGFFALLLIVIGLLRKDALIRYFGLGLMALVISKLWFIILAMPNALNRIAAFIIIGLVFIVASFVYQRLSKRLLEK